MSEVVVITGASAGVGRAVTRLFAERGASIGLLARGRDGLEAACEEVEELGGKAIVLQTDVSDADAVDAAAARVEETFGPIDIWINNAMVSVIAPVHEMSGEEFRRVTEVTYLGVVYGTLAALRRMLPRDRGTIVQIGSGLAHRGIPLQSAYCGAKHAIRGFCDSLRSELMHDGSHVRVTLVNLPAINTPQFRWVRNRMPRKAQPFGSVFQPEVAAEAIVWAADHPGREINVGLGTAALIFANKLAPGVLDYALARAGVEGQQGQEPETPGRPDNLFSPLPGDHGAHGAFDDRAKAPRLHMSAATHRGWIAMAVAVAGGLWLLKRITSREEGSSTNREGARRKSQ